MTCDMDAPELNLTCLMKLLQKPNISRIYQQSAEEQTKGSDLITTKICHIRKSALDSKVVSALFH